MTLLTALLSLPAHAFDPVPSAVVEGTWRPAYIAVSFAGDLDGDGYDEMLLSRVGGVSLHHGSPTGPGTDPDLDFSSPLLDFGEIRSIGDVNGDGFGDMAIVSRTEVDGPASVLVHYGSMMGVSQQPDQVLSGGARMSPALAHGDVDGDGYDDLLIGMAAEGRVEVYLGGPSGLSSQYDSFVSRTALGYSLAVGDVDGDGHPDFVATVDEADHDAIVYTGDGAGNFTLGAFVTGSRNALNRTLVNLADFDGDGVHTVVASGTIGELGVFLGTWPNLGASVLSYQPTADNITWNFGNAAAGDIDGDGYDDLLISAGMDRLVLYGSATNLPALSALEPEGYAFPHQSVGLGDADGDGQLDLLEACATCPDPGVRLYLDPTYPEPTVSRTWSSSVPELVGRDLVGLGDVNGDGREDVASTCQPEGVSGARRCVFVGTSTGLDADPVLDLPGPLVAGGDVDGDGFSDVLTLADDALSLHRGGLAGPSAVADQVLPLPASVSVNGFDLDRDLDGDGRSDLVLRATRNGDAVLVFVLGTSSGLGRPRIVWDAPTDAILGVADLDGDGWLDVLAETPAGDDLAWVPGTGPGSVGAPQPLGLSLQTLPTHLVAGDFDGDGFADVALSGPSFSTCTDPNDCVVIHGSATGPDLSRVVPLTRRPLWAGDLDGDGFADLVTGDPDANAHNGVAAVHYGASTGLSEVEGLLLDGVDVEELGSAATAVDVDGDGDVELVVGASAWNANAGRLLVFDR